MNESIISLAKSMHPIKKNNLKDAILNTYTNIFDLINRAKVEIITGTLSDRLETSLIGQLSSSSILNLDSISQYKTPKFRSALRILSTHSRLITGFLFIPVSNFFAMIFINTFTLKSDAMYWIITYFSLSIFYLLYYQSHFYRYILHILLGLSLFFSFTYIITIIFMITPFKYTYYFDLFHSFTVIIAFLASLITACFTAWHIDRRNQAFRHLTSLGISIDYKTIQSLLSMFFILCGYQKNVELADEDGWE
jgi:hypothetical protein